MLITGFCVSNWLLLCTKARQEEWTDKERKAGFFCPSKSESLSSFFSVFEAKIRPHAVWYLISHKKRKTLPDPSNQPFLSLLGQTIIFAFHPRHLCVLSFKSGQMRQSGLTDCLRTPPQTLPAARPDFHNHIALNIQAIIPSSEVLCNQRSNLRRRRPLSVAFR